jgi:hypothetical protein
MSNITRNHKISLLAVFLVASLFVATLAIAATGNDVAYAKKKKINEAEQEIEQDQDNDQEAQCVSGTLAIVSCNQLGLQFGLNTGNEALGQQ